MIKRIFYCIIITTVALYFYACNKTLAVDPTHIVPEKNMWKVKNDARSAVFATYGLLRAALASNNAYFVYGELRAGDFSSTTRSDLMAIRDNNLNITSPILENLKSWQRFYAVIAQANTCLEKLPQVAKNDFRYTSDNLALDIANIKYVRALVYFYLVRIWGDVPINTLSVGVAESFPRENWHKVLDYAKGDALAALNGLPWKYDGQSPEQQGGDYWDRSASDWQGNIASKGATYALLSHIEAWKGNYLDAAAYAKVAIDNKSLEGYDIVDINTLTNTSGGVFSGQAGDIIFALPFNASYQESSGAGHLEDWTLANPYSSKQTPDVYVCSDSIINIFDEINDTRFGFDVNGLAKGNYFYGYGNTMPIFRKIMEYSASGINPLPNYQSAIVIFRYEELILLRAEALNFLGKTNQTIELINSIRVQRGLSALPSEFTGDLSEQLLQERRRELLGEGWRWYDIVRFGKVSDFTSLNGKNVDDGAIYWPLSKDVLNNNPSLEQNNFWKH